MRSSLSYQSIGDKRILYKVPFLANQISIKSVIRFARFTLHSWYKIMKTKLSEKFKALAFCLNLSKFVNFLKL